MRKVEFSVREEIAAVQHEIWAHWMRYLFDCCEAGSTGELIIPSDKVWHWKRQMTIKYSDLTEKEQGSDREQADKILRVLKGVGNDQLVDAIDV